MKYQNLLFEFSIYVEHLVFLVKGPRQQNIQMDTKRNCICIGYYKRIYNRESILNHEDFQNEKIVIKSETETHKKNVSFGFNI